MDLTEGSETSAIINQTPGNYPKESLLDSVHGENLKSRRLSMNFHKVHFLQFTPKNSPEIDLDISYANKLISKTYDTEFLGIYVENTVMGDSY